MEDTIDPWDWDSQRVVQELCTNQRTWNPPTNPPKLPDSERLRASLEDNEVDGQCFLGSASEEADFWSDIGIKSIRHKETLRSARNQFRRRSRKYKIWKVRQEQDDEDEEDDPIGQLDEVSRKRKLEEERKEDSEESAYNSPRAIISESSTPAAHPQAVTPTIFTPVAPQTPTVKPAEIPANSDEPVRKKRRIAPVTLSADVSIDHLRNIPQGNLVSELKPVAEDANDKIFGAYLGEYVLNRADIVDFDFAGQPLTNEDLEFVFQREPYPIGMRRQRARLVSRWLGKWQPVFRPAKADLVPGGDDPEHYEVLPAYGESDDEYDSDTWREIQKEEEQRKKRKEKHRKELSAEEKKTMVDQYIAEKIAAWQSDKLPVLQQKSNRIWNKAHRQGLKHCLDRETRQKAHLQKRLDKYRDEIVNQQLSNEADMRKIDGILDQTIRDLQESTWLLDLLKLPDEPKKLLSIPRQRPANLGQQEREAGSDEETLTGESESDDAGLGNFVIDDELELRDEVMIEAGDDGTAEAIRATQENSASPPRVAADKEDLGIADGTENFSMKDDHSTGHEPSEIPCTYEVLAPSTERDKSQPDTPSLGRNHVAAGEDIGAKGDPMDMRDARIDEDDILDLTQAEIPIKEEETSTPKPDASLMTSLSVHPKAPIVIDLVTPKKRQANAQPPDDPASRFAWSPHPHLGISHRQAEKMSENERSVLELIQSLDERHRSVLFSMTQWQVVDLWKGSILPALHVLSLPSWPLKSPEENDTFYGLQFARLFDAFLGHKSQHLRLWFKSLSGRATPVEKEDQFKSFVVFLRALSLCYQVASVPKKPATPSAPAVQNLSARALLHGTDSDLDGEQIGIDSDDDIDLVHKKRKQPVIRRDEAAMSLRESDIQRVEEQAERRKALRVKLALMGDTAASQNMRFIINESKEDHQGFIYVPQNIAGHIKDHQISGVRFMWNQVVMNAKDRQGCLLAHTMGLGKTMQIITLLMTIADSAVSEDPSVSSQIPEDLKQSKTLVLAPSGLVNNWEDEFIMWTDGAAHHLGEIWKIESTYKDHIREEILEAWTTKGGVLIIGYDLFRALVTRSSAVRAQLLTNPNIVVADEAHQLKSSKSQIHQITAEFKTHIRIALTGSPLANNVQEYYAMINWIATNYLGDPTEFRQVFANPIESGISVDSTRSEWRRALVKLRSLKETVAPKVHRRTIHALKDELPQKTEFVIMVPLTEVQRKAYELYMNFQYSGSEMTRLFATLNVLGLLCNHPACFRERLLKQKNSQVPADEQTNGTALPPQFVSEALTAIRHSEITGAKGEEHSWKVPLLNSILDESHRQGDKVLVFSQSIPTINYLESVLRRRKRNYTRLDGSTKINRRQDMVKDFNRNSFDVFLISTTAGGYGLNITGANRVVIFDFKFNPQHEQQAVGRVYRLGQTKPVFVYRLVCGGTYEEKMQNKGIFKMQLASRVVDKKNPIPRGLRFEEFFAPPTEPKQEGLSHCVGKDKVLDAILSTDVGKGVRSVVMADTFEEENIEDEQLTQEEVQEAKQLIEMHQARLTGKPFVAVPLPGILGGVRRLSPPKMSSSAIADAGVNGTSTHGANGHSLGVPSSSAVAAVVSEGLARGAPASSSERTGSGATFIPENSLKGAPHPSFQPGAVKPIFGSTTQVRDPTAHSHTNLSAGELNFWSNANILKQELSRLFARDEKDIAVIEERKRMAQQIGSAFNEQSSRRDHQESTQAKSALVEAVHDSRPFAHAVLTGKHSPAFLASLTAEAIRELIPQEAGKTLATTNPSSESSEKARRQPAEATQEAASGRSHKPEVTPSISTEVRTDWSYPKCRLFLI